MKVRLSALVILLGALLLGGCAALPTPASPPDRALPTPLAPLAPSATATTLPTTPAPTPSPASPPPTTEALTSTPPPAPTEASAANTGAAIRAAAVGPDGLLDVLLSTGAVSRYSADLSRLVSTSGPLFEGHDPGRAHIEAGERFLVVSSETLTRTLVLERESFAPIWEFDSAGPIGLDGSRRLFVATNEAVWAYDLANAAAGPVPVTKWPVDSFTPRPRNLAVDAAGGQVLVTLVDISASPPHRQEWYAGYDLDTLQPIRSYPSQLGELTRPSVAGDWIVAGMAAKNGYLGSKVTVFDRQGHEAAAAQPMEGRPVVDAAAEWIYVLRERGIWVLSGHDLRLVAMSPFAGSPPTDLLLSPDGQKLYSIFEDSISVQDTAALRSAGLAPLARPLPANWFYPTLPNYAFGGRFFPATDEIAFAQVGGYGETWRTTDRGQTWELLPGLVHPNFHYVTHLSISPDFATDRTIVAVGFDQPAYLRSTDGGDTWSAWEPPVAFVSDREGGLAVYTAERGQPGEGVAHGIVRRSAVEGGNQNPAWSPGWTRIAYQSMVDGNWEILTQRADCAPVGDQMADCDVRRITDDAGDDLLPAWSPDGRWIAFVSTRSGTPQIDVAPASGGPAQQLTEGPNGAWRPAWAPNGQWLYFTGTGADGSNDIHVLRHIWDADGAFDAPEVLSVVASPADERDPAVGREFFVYLSNESGGPRAYGRYFYDQATSFPFTTGTEAEGHPTVLDDGTNTVLLTLEREGRTGIYRANSSGYEPFVVDGTFNGQPATGTAPWQPDPDLSQYRAEQWQAGK